MPRHSRRQPALFFLILFSSVSPLATDMYLAAFPAMAESLGTQQITIQLSFSTFIFGMSAGQLVIGPLSDGMGRRPLLIAGCIVFSLAGLACGLVQDGITLAALRFIQGFSGSAGVVLGRAIVTDSYAQMDAAKRFSTITMYHALAPVLAPGIGGLIILWLGWRAVFFSLFLLGAVMVMGAVWAVPETLPRSKRSGAGLRANGQRIMALLRERPFMRYVTVACFACAGYFTHIAGSSIVLHGTYGIDEGQYTIFFMTNALGMGAVMVFGRLMIGRIDSHRMLRAGLIVAVSASALLSAAAALGAAPYALAWFCLFAVTMGMGMCLPNIVILAQRTGARYPGTASALQGGLQFLSGALFSPLTGLFPATSVIPLAVLMLSFMTVALTALNWRRSRSSAP